MRSRFSVLFAFVVVLVLFVAAPASAQTLEGTFTFGYSVMRELDQHRTYPTGWVVGVAGKARKKMDIAVEYNGEFVTVNALAARVRHSVITFTAGPRFAATDRKVMPFGHVLLGVSRIGTRIIGIPDSGAGNTGFAIQPGGGVDVKVHEMFNLRFQTDYRAILRGGGATSNEVRLVFGASVPFRG